MTEGNEDETEIRRYKTGSIVPFVLTTDTFHLAEHRFLAWLAVYNADRDTVQRQHLGIHVNSRGFTEGLFQVVSQMQLELVWILKTILINTDDSAVIGDADQQLAPLGVEKCCNRLQACLRYRLVILFRVQVQAKRTLKLPTWAFASSDDVAYTLAWRFILIELNVLKPCSGIVPQTLEVLAVGLVIHVPKKTRTIPRGLP